MKGARIGICICLLLCSLVLLMPTGVSATDMDEGKCGDNVYWKYELDGTLTISGTGEMWIFYSAEGPWAAFTTSVKRVIIEDGVTSIGEYAFRDFENLSYVQIPESVLSIGGAAFLNCTALTEITLPSGITKIYFSTFSGCASLIGIVLPDGVTGIAPGAFEGCTSLEYIVIPAGLVGIGYDAFKDCSNLWHILYRGNKGQWKNLTIPIYHADDQDNADALEDVKVHYGARWRKQIDPTTDLCKICRRNIIFSVLFVAAAVFVVVKIIRRRNRLF